jgi:sugar phosphate isomerase/epimerase
MPHQSNDPRAALAIAMAPAILRASASPFCSRLPPTILPGNQEEPMLDLKTSLGVQSYCFRGFKPLPDLLAQIKALGLAHCEVCRVHVDFNDEATFADAIAQFKAAGIAITSIGVQTFKGEPQEEKWFAFAKAAGCRMIAATFDVTRAPGVFAITEKLAEKYDLVLGIHNHGGYHWLGNGDMLRHVFNTTGERIGLCIDSAWCLQSAEDPVKWATEFSKRLFGIHIKDFTFDRAGKWTDVIVGTGNLKLPEFLRASLAATNLKTATLEYEGDINNPGPALKQCVAAVGTAI